jgi:hypothetical protein
VQEFLDQLKPQSIAGLAMIAFAFLLIGWSIGKWTLAKLRNINPRE